MQFVCRSTSEFHTVFFLSISNGTIKIGAKKKSLTYGIAEISANTFKLVVSIGFVFTNRHLNGFYRDIILFKQICIVYIYKCAGKAHINCRQSSKERNFISKWAIFTVSMHIHGILTRRKKKKYRTVKNVSYLYIAFDVCAGIDVKKNKQTQIVHLSSMMETTTSSKIENEQRQII